MPLYGRDVWDPRLILAQMAVMQCVHYLAMGVFYGVCNVVFGTRLSLTLFFSWEALSIASTRGWMAIVTNTVAAAIGAAALPVVVERAKKCWDFTFTVYFVHWLACVGFSGFPSSWTWWLTMLLCVIIVIISGVIAVIVMVFITHAFFFLRRVFLACRSTAAVFRGFR